MVTTEQATRGLKRFIEAVLLPHLTGFKHLALYGVKEMVGDSFIGKYIDNPVIASLDAVDGNMINIDRIYQIYAPLFDNKYTLDIPVLGEFTFNRGDLDMLYRFIKEA